MDKTSVVNKFEHHLNDTHIIQVKLQVLKTDHVAFTVFLL